MEILISYSIHGCIDYLVGCNAGEMQKKQKQNSKLRLKQKYSKRKSKEERGNERKDADQ